MAISTKQSTKVKKSKGLRTKRFENARSAALTLLSSVSKLSSTERETLEMLLDKKLGNHLSKSSKEAKKGKIEPIENIL